MKVRYLKLKRWLIVSLTGLMGLQVGCEKESYEEEYGCPETIYRVKGTVVDDSGTPVAGIGIGCWNLYEADDQYVFYYDTTDNTGRFVCEHFEGFPKDTTIAVALSDMDGVENGYFADTVVSVPFLKSELQGGDGEWFFGEAEKEITVTLRRK